MKGIIKDSIILFIITLLVGLLLGSVYYITKEPIAKQDKIAKDKANKAVFADAESFEEFTELNLETLLDGTAYKKTCEVNDVLIAKKDDQILGYVITITSKEGYGGDIKFAVGIRKDGTVNGISFLQISETAGLGMNATKPKFYEQFADKKVDEFVYTKDGATSTNEIDAISSATITTNAVTNGVNCAIKVSSIVNRKVGDQ